PGRDTSLVLSPVAKARVRKPSCFRSKIHTGWSEGLAAMPKRHRGEGRDHGCAAFQWFQSVIAMIIASPMYSTSWAATMRSGCQAWSAVPSGGMDQDVGERRSLGTKLTVDGTFNASKVDLRRLAGERLLRILARQPPPSRRLEKRSTGWHPNCY